ncbi:MAG: CDP-alcohol phosphatidyltransferase family protein [Verrucomicrobia bacterium]|nr:MAG: CDP-alcohol phosphatidyltransferase family protein [Verrucomicrobiota bacterium]
MDSYQIGDRRPLASRGWKTSERVASWFARRGVTPNAISIVGMVCGITAGVMFLQTPNVSHPWILWLGGALFVQLRLLANLCDGMVAVLRQAASPVGELFNEVPDRVSDAAALIGFGYAAGSNALLGFVATSLAIFLAYLRAQGKVAGAHQEFCGPMAKQQRMATVTVAAVACAVIPGATEWQVPMFALWLIIAGCTITVFRRLQRISASLRHR